MSEKPKPFPYVVLAGTFDDTSWGMFENLRVALTEAAKHPDRHVYERFGLSTCKAIVGHDDLLKLAKEIWKIWDGGDKAYTEERYQQLAAAIVMCEKEQICQE